MEFEQKTAKLDAGELRYRVAGEGSPLLYLHGASGWVRTRAQELLAESHRLFIPTQPGIDGGDYLDGVDSMTGLAALNAEFVRSEIGDSCDVVGHSFGGWLAAWFAVTQGDLVGQLVLQCPAGIRPGGKGGLSDDPEELFRTLYVHPEKRLPDERAPEAAGDNRKRVRHYTGGVPLDEELVARLGEIEALTLVLHGTAEEIIPIETCRILKENIGRAYISYMYDAAHNIEVDQPERFAGIVADFLARGEAFIVNQANDAA